METIIQYFSTIPSTHRAIILFGGIAFFWIIENGIPHIRYSYNKTKHGGLNIVFTLTTVLVNFVLAFILLKTTFFVTENHWGLWNIVDIPLALKTILGLMLFDFIGAYLIHYLEHKIPFLWRFHIIHHTDQEVDTTTANRHHPGESILRFSFTTLAILVVGAPFWLVMLYQSLSAVCSQFSHANIKLPTWFENIFNKFFVTPHFHRIHHHYMMPYTDSNYSNIFSIWDYIFRTNSDLPEKDWRFGVDTHMNPTEVNSVGYLMKLPAIWKK